MPNFLEDFFKSTLDSTHIQRGLNRGAGFTIIADSKFVQNQTGNEKSPLIAPGVIFFTYLFGAIRKNAPLKERFLSSFWAVLNLGIWWLYLALMLNRDGDKQSNKNMEDAIVVLECVFIASFLALAGTGELVKAVEPATTVPAIEEPAAQMQV